jgi:hypothetical protein
VRLNPKKKLDKETRELQSVVSNNNNTKREIKELTVIIRSLMSNLMAAEMLNMIRAHSGLGEKEKKNKESRNEETQTPQCEEEWAETRRQAYKTMASGKKSILPKKPEDLYKISTKGWNEEVYSKVRSLQDGGPKTTGRGNVALVLDEAEIIYQTFITYRIKTSSHLPFHLYLSMYILKK